MKDLEIEQLVEKDELNADAFISLGIGSEAEIERAKMRKMKSTASTNRKRSTRLPHLEISTTIKQMMESDWISASESLLE